MDIIVKKLTTTTTDVVKYIESVKRADELLSKLFDPTMLMIGKNTIIFLASIDAEPVGMIIAKPEQINQRKYLRMYTLRGDNAEVLGKLVDAMVEYYKASNIDGIFTSVLDDSNKQMITAIEHAGFKAESRLFARKPSELVTKLPKSNGLESIRFDKRTRSEYQRAFSKLLVAFDSEMDKSRNDSIGHKVYKEILERDTQSRIRVAYFMVDVVKSSDWYAYLILKDDEPIGFIKGKVVDGMCAIDMYFPEKIFSKYHAKALRIFVNQLEFAKYLTITEYVSNTSKLNMMSSLFGKSIGTEYFMK